MTYLISYSLLSYKAGPFHSVFQKRGSFVVEADSCEGAVSVANDVLRDAVAYGVKNLRYPEGVRVHISSMLPTEPPKPTIEQFIAATGRKK